MRGASVVTDDLFFALSNYIEAAFWILVGFVCASYAIRRLGVIRRRCWQAACTFVAFGGSDIVEVQTGAWWHPWWLLVWKGVCIVVLIVLLVDYWRRPRTAG